MSTASPTSSPDGLNGPSLNGPSLNKLRLGLGVLGLILGIAVLAWPGKTLLIVAILFGLQLIAAGVVRLVLAQRLSNVPKGIRIVSLVLGALTVIAGVICLVRPGTSLLVIIWTIAAGWLVDGISELVAGFGVHRTGLERATRIFFGITSIIGAILILIFPGPSLVLFTQIGGVLLIIFGVITIATSIRERRSSTVKGQASGETSTNRA